MLFGDEIKKVFLAGIGAIAETIETGQEMVDSLVEKGELTVKQGKILNEELKHGFKENGKDLKDSAAKKEKILNEELKHGLKENGKDLKNAAVKKETNILDSVEKLSHDELLKLKQKIAELEKKK